MEIAQEQGTNNTTLTDSPSKASDNERTFSIENFLARQDAVIDLRESEMRNNLKFHDLRQPRKGIFDFQKPLTPEMLKKQNEL